MNIKERISFWQDVFCCEFCDSPEEKEESNQELELVLFAIDTLTNLDTNGLAKRDIEFKEKSDRLSKLIHRMELKLGITKTDEHTDEHTDEAGDDGTEGVDGVDLDVRDSYGNPPGHKSTFVKDAVKSFTDKLKGK